MEGVEVGQRADATAITGELHRDASGILHGWCWDAARPGERLGVDIVIGHRIVASFLASRFRMDLRDNGIGDGYHGFSVSLARTLASADADAMVSARERKTGSVFGRIVPAAIGVPRGLEAKLQGASEHLSSLTRSLASAAQARRNPYLRGAEALGALAPALRARVGRNQHRPRPVAAAFSRWGAVASRIDLPTVMFPNLTVSIYICRNAALAFAAVSRLTIWLRGAEAEGMLLDDGGMEDAGLFAALVPGMRQIRIAGASPARLRAAAARDARAERLIFFGPTGPGPAMPAPDQLPEREELVVRGALADAAARIRPDLAARVRHEHVAPTGLRLAFPTALVARTGAYADALLESDELADIDLVLRALDHGYKVTAWHEGHGSGHRRAVPCPVAERAFAANWGIAV